MIVFIEIPEKRIKVQENEQHKEEIEQPIENIVKEETKDDTNENTKEDDTEKEKEDKDNSLILNVLKIGAGIAFLGCTAFLIFKKFRAD